jgi:hypothetical protein
LTTLSVTFELLLALSRMLKGMVIVTITVARAQRSVFFKQCSLRATVRKVAVAEGQIHAAKKASA